MTNSRPRPASEAYAEKYAETVDPDETYYIPEKYQLGIVTDWLEANEIAYTTEGRVFFYPIDILATKHNSTVAIELKSRNVGKGIDQARRNCDFVDYSYLSVWEEDVTDELIDRVTDLDIGLLGISDSIVFHSVASNTSKELCKKNTVIKTIATDVRGDTPVRQLQSEDDD